MIKRFLRFPLNIGQNKKIMCVNSDYCHLSYDVASGSEITPCNKIDKPLVVYRFSGKRYDVHTDKIITFLQQK